MPNKRILVVCQHFWPESFRINDLCYGFIEKGLEVDVLCGQPNYPKGEWYEGYGPLSNRQQTHQGIHIYRTFEVKRGSNSNFRIFINYITFPIASIFYVPKLLRKKYDKVFIYSLSPVYMGLAGIIIGRLKKIEIITYVMDLWPENLYSGLAIKNGILRKILFITSTWFYKKSDKIVCLTKKAADILQERTQKRKSLFCVVPQCCERIYENPIHDQNLFERFGNKFNVVFTGNISPAQDFPIIIQAAENLKNDCEINWIIVGDGMSRKKVESEVKTRGLSDIFFFEGFKPISEIPKYTKIASCLVACLVKSELLDCTVPAKVLSYFASGKPIALAMDGEANKLVNEYGCGYACASGDVESLTENIRQIYMLSEKERAEMGECAHKLHLQQFERDMLFDHLLQFVFNETM